MKTSKLIFSGLCMALAGLTILLSEQIGVPTAQILVPVLFIIGGLFSLAFSRDLKAFPTGQVFHLIQGAGMVIFGLLIALIPDDLGSFLQFISYFVLAFAMIELGFALMALSSKGDIKWSLLSFRAIAAAAGFIAALTILFTSFSDAHQSLLIAGLVIVLAGLSFVVFAQRIKGQLTASAD